MFSLYKRLFPVLPRTRTFVVLFFALWGSVAANVYGNYPYNLNAVMTGICLTVVLVVISILVADSVEGRIQYPSGPMTDSMHNYALFSFLALPFALTVFVSSFFFFNGKEPQWKRIWIVDGIVMPEGKVLIAVPFFQKIRSVAVNQNVSMSAIATTKDGVQVKGFVHAELKLDPDSSTILRLVENFKNPDEQIRRELEELLEIQFRYAVKHRPLADLNNDLVLEWETGKDIPDKTLSMFGVKWAGGVRITDLHPYFVKNPTKELLISI